MIRITVAAAADIIHAANHYAMCVGQSVADINTYTGLNWQDSAGNLYAAASFIVSPEWLVFSQLPVVRPDWDTEEVIDLQLAAQGQAALRFWSPDSATEPPKAQQSLLIAYANSGVQEALALMGLTPKGEIDG